MIFFDRYYSRNYACACNLSVQCAVLDPNTTSQQYIMGNHLTVDSWMVAVQVRNQKPLVKSNTYVHSDN